MTTDSTMTRSRANWALAALFLGAFVVGNAELVVVGVLNQIARDMSVSISTAGTLVTGYALGIAFGGPLLTAATIRFGRRPMLQLSLALYVAGNVLAVVAVNFGMLVVARVVTGCLHGLFIGVALAVAVALVPRERMGSAISIVIGGIAVSTALGVPLGTLIGQELGWQAAFVAIIAIGVVALAALLALVPPVPNTGVGGLSAQAKHALAPPVLAMLGFGFLVMGGQFAALTYLSPFLEQVTGISGGAISLFLLAYGIANAIGTLAGGRAADRNASATLIVATAVLVLALGLVYFARSSPAAVAVGIGVWGLVGFGLVPSLQYRVVGLAGPGRDLAATLPASAVTAGIAGGASVGGWAVARYGIDAAVLTGAVTCAAAFVAAIAVSFLKAPAPAGAAPGSVREPTAEQQVSPQPATS